jgi:hypothetical protein
MNMAIMNTVATAWTMCAICMVPVYTRPGAILCQHRAGFPDQAEEHAAQKTTFFSPALKQHGWAGSFA